MAKNDRYLIGFETLVEISELQKIIYRIQNECDAHANALATQALDKIAVIQNDVLNLDGFEITRKK